MQRILGDSELFSLTINLEFDRIRVRDTLSTLIFFFSCQAVKALRRLRVHMAGSLLWGIYTYDVCTGRGEGGPPKADDSTDKLCECDSDLAEVMCTCPLIL